jgi:hypothetical protein
LRAATLLRASGAPDDARSANEWIAPIKATVKSEPPAVGYCRFDVTGRPDCGYVFRRRGQATTSGDKGVSEVPKARHRRAKPPRRRRIVALVVPATALLPASVAAWPSEQKAHPDAVNVVAAPDFPERAARLGRDGSGRQPLTAPPRSTAPSSKATRSKPKPKPAPPQRPRPKPTVTGYLYVATALNVRAAPSTVANALTVLARGTRIGVTGKTDRDWVQVVYDGKVAWVNGRYLSKSKPAEEPRKQPAKPTQAGGISYAPCPSGSAVESGLTPDAIRVHRAVCARFPSVSSYGGLRSGGGEHSQGRALDIMVPSGSLGDAIASWVRANYKRLGVSEVIWAQRIWTVQRASEGWRLMEDRGSVTANHYDHVHVTVYGNAGS